MNRDIYYTPSIEEFHVGFECEIQSSYGYQKDIYPNILKCDTMTFQESIDKGEIEALKKATIRVKYLDKEDIESLGWIDGEIRGLSGFLFNWDSDNEYQMYYQFDNQYMQIYDCLSDSVFKGIIKNKSELTRLMNWLNLEPLIMDGLHTVIALT